MGPRHVTRDRRTHQRLRDLCDEVLASYRVAADKDLFSDADRLEARTLTAKLLRAPAAH